MGLKLSQLREALDHMAAHADSDDPQIAVVAEHDQLWIGPEEFKLEVSEDCKSRMSELGFSWDDEYQTWVLYT